MRRSAAGTTDDARDGGPVVCSSCGRENPADFAFCPACGSNLAPPTAPEPRGGPPSQGHGPPREERKVVTLLFCDLVSFTAHSEASDHELIDGLLQQYDEVAKRLVEEHGGIVEKYIGDAVVAVFGFPHAHDDDAERALRTALGLVKAAATLTWPDGEPVQVRIGINSGETYLHRDVDPASGRSFLTGDAVNTAARLETAAPANGVVVGELTHDLTERVVDYEELEPLAVKGKRDAVRAWLAKDVRESRSRTGLRTTGSADTPFVGRRRELDLLLADFDQAATLQEPRFDLLLGEPGIGKSRLVLELARALDQRPELITWRQGRCRPYGESATFGALADVVKAHAGILDSDDAEASEAKIDAVAGAGPDAAWVAQRLRALLGLPAAQADREENFAAWSAFLAALAADGSAVICFEDLHWADEGLLAFLEDFTRRDSRVPLLVVATARPEFLEQCPEALKEGKGWRQRSLSSLRRRDVSRLLSSLVDERLAADVRATMLARAGGNPLYAEECVRLLLDRDLLVSEAGVLRLKGDAPPPLPETVQAVLAARIDTLRPLEREVLCDAAVLGEAFWSGAVVALRRREVTEVREALLTLVDREFVRETTGSIFAGESEFAFWHALSRDAAYALLPKKVRLHRHVEAASWIAAKAGERPDGLAESIAHHYVTALDLAGATQDLSQRAVLAPRAGHFLALAGEHAFRVDLSTAQRHLARAVELLPDGRERGHALHVYARALCLGGDPVQGIVAFETAARLLQAAGDANGAGSAWIEEAMWRGTIGQCSEDLLAEGLQALDFEQPTGDLVRALTEIAICRCGGGMEFEGCQTACEQALEVARRIGQPPPPTALVYRGVAKARLRRDGWLEDIRHGLELAESQGLGGELARLLAAYDFTVSNELGPPAGLKAARECVAFARRHGMQYWVSHEQCTVIINLAETGQWDEALEEAAALEPELLQEGWQDALLVLRLTVADLRCKRGDTGVAEDWSRQMASDARAPDASPFHASLCLVVAASLRHLVGDDGEARALLSECLDRFGTSVVITPAVRLAVALDEVVLAERFVAGMTMIARDDEYALLTSRALIAEAKGELKEAVSGFCEAAQEWAAWGLPYEEAQALLGQGRCLAALGKAGEAAIVFAQAREIFMRLGAGPALAELEASDSSRR